MKVGTDGVALGAWSAGGQHILDIGTGTGLIALMMAQRFPQATVRGIDIDPSACQQASENSAESPFAGRVNIVHQSLQQFKLAGEPFDAIVSNPPYYDTTPRGMTDRHRYIARHTEMLSFHDLLAGVVRLLSDNGIFSVIVPADRRNDLLAETYIAGLFPVRLCDMHTQPAHPPKRCLFGFARHPVAQVETNAFSIYDEHRNYSADWLRLTSDFLL